MLQQILQRGLQNTRVVLEITYSQVAVMTKYRTYLFCFMAMIYVETSTPHWVGYTANGTLAILLLEHPVEITPL
jgi:hypothetical protein